jgi:hypothetical protein
LFVANGPAQAALAIALATAPFVVGVLAAGLAGGPTPIAVDAR